VGLGRIEMGYARRIGSGFKGHALKRLRYRGNCLFAVIGKRDIFPIYLF
jgi:hypothetical protein